MRFFLNKLEAEHFKAQLNNAKVHTLNPSTQEAETGRALGLQSLVYRTSFRTARATQRNLVSKTK